MSDKKNSSSASVRLLCAAAFCWLAAWLVPHPAAAAVTVTPTLVTLGPGHTTALITLINDADQPARFEASLNGWSESPDGETMLAPNNDVVVFPQLITLDAHETKKVRVGTELAPNAIERSYRLILQELPQLNRDNGQVEIQVLTKISLPVFLTPRGAQAKAVIDAPKLENGVLSFDVTNAGAAHFVLHQVDVIGQSAAGEAFSLSANGWYVLAGGRRTFHVALAAADCRRATAIIIKAAGDVAPAQTRLPVSAAACGAASQSQFLKSGGPA